VSAELLLGLSSVAGAAFFFAAGRLAAGQRKAMAPLRAVAPPATDGRGDELRAAREQTAHARQESEQLRAELGAAQIRLAELAARVGALSSQLGEERTRRDEARQRVARGETERANLEERLRGLAALEAELEERRMESHRWREQTTELERQLASAVSAETVQTLRQDLAVKGELLAVHDQRANRLEEQNALLRQELAAASGLGAERDRLRLENAELRADEFVARPAPRDRPLALAGGKSTPGGILQALVERVSSLGDIRCAVIADDLGLVVASQGELSDEVAAVGALFGRASLHAKRVLPLHGVLRVNVEDDQNVVLGVRPLSTDAGPGVELALVTLAVGAPPDPRRLSKLIDEREQSLESSP
jgi:hypothetical protein